jgi:hypothetical protein
MAKQSRQDQLLHLYAETAGVTTQFITTRGEEAAALLCRHGIQAMALQGGFPAWKEAELPEESTAG